MMIEDTGGHLHSSVCGNLLLGLVASQVSTTRSNHLSCTPRSDRNSTSLIFVLYHRISLAANRCVAAFARHNTLATRQNSASIMESKGQTVYGVNDPKSSPDLRFIHFNDVYHIDPSSAEPVGGIARFQTLCNHYRNDKRFEGQPELITLFSGDAFNPSLESSVTKGTSDHQANKYMGW